MLVLSRAITFGSPPRWLWAALIFTVACAAADPDDAAHDPSESQGADPSVEDLTPTEHLVRISTALTGERPTPAELETVRDDPATLEGMVDGYLEREGFAEMIRDLYNEALQVRVGAALYPAGFPPVGALAELDLQTINTAVTEAPLRLIEHVIMNDRPLTEIVTADYGVANGIVADVWGMDYAGDGQEWGEARYLDGRTHAGILSDSWLFTRYSTTFSNQNRGRANAISRALLCTDYVERKLEVDTSINLADPDEVANAVAENSACASCHQTLDPLAAYFASYSPIFLAMQVESYPVTFYQPEIARAFSVREAGYFGFTGGDVRYLGSLIADDPRFSLCTAKRFYAYLHQVPLDQVPQARAASLQSLLISEGLRAKALAKAVVLSDAFRAKQPTEVTAEASNSTDNAERAPDPNGLLKVRPWQLARLVESQTGFRWDVPLEFSLDHGAVGTVDLMRDTLFGYEVLAGGIDSQNVSQPAHTMTATTSLVLGGLAAGAADRVVDEDLATPSGARLLEGVDEADTSEGAVRAVLSAAFLRLYGRFEAPDSEAMDTAYGLFRDALFEADGDAKRAWKTTVFALLQDPSFVFY